MRLPLVRIAGKLRVLLVRMASGKLRIAKSCGACYVRAVKCPDSPGDPPDGAPSEIYIPADCETGCPYFGGQVVMSEGQSLLHCYTIESAGGIRELECGIPGSGPRPYPRIYNTLPPGAVVRTTVQLEHVDTTCASDRCYRPPANCCLSGRWETFCGGGDPVFCVCDQYAIVRASGEFIADSTDYDANRAPPQLRTQHTRISWGYTFEARCCEHPPCETPTTITSQRVEIESGYDRNWTIITHPDWAGIIECGAPLVEELGFLYGTTFLRRTPCIGTLDQSTSHGYIEVTTWDVYGDCQGGHVDVTRRVDSGTANPDRRYTYNSTYNAVWSYETIVPCNGPGQPDNRPPPIGLRSLAL